MATEVGKGVKVQAKFTGPMVNEKQTYVSKTYGSVQAAADNQSILDMVDTLATLQDYPVKAVYKTTVVELQK